MTQVQRDCCKMILLVCLLDYTMIEATGWVIDRAKQIAIERHGCRSVKCFRLEWAFER